MGMDLYTHKIPPLNSPPSISEIQFLRLNLNIRKPKKLSAGRQDPRHRHHRHHRHQFPLLAINPHRGPVVQASFLDLHRGPMVQALYSPPIRTGVQWFKPRSSIRIGVQWFKPSTRRRSAPRSSGSSPLLAADPHRGPVVQAPFLDPHRGPVVQALYSLPIYTEVQWFKPSTRRRSALRSSGSSPVPRSAPGSSGSSPLLAADPHRGLVVQASFLDPHQASVVQALLSVATTVQWFRHGGDDAGGSSRRRHWWWQLAAAMMVEAARGGDNGGGSEEPRRKKLIYFKRERRRSRSLALQEEMSAQKVKEKQKRAEAIYALKTRSSCTIYASDRSLERSKVAFRPASLCSVCVVLSPSSFFSCYRAEWEVPVTIVRRRSLCKASEGLKKGKGISNVYVDGCVYMLQAKEFGVTPHKLEEQGLQGMREGVQKRVWEYGVTPHELEEQGLQGNCESVQKRVW
ncbi:hypothetical protein LR48_Vigan04g069000 [Vigna angularis]|uniref:Uncharacterized protein n=1 Tax=Phaseolus angularis TaxID=3914 RepID=A0A0L9UD82_PHAAN|nr:hypothetical protein LR48_Vigan04g069000 [Vigna angularis]